MTSKHFFKISLWSFLICAISSFIVLLFLLLVGIIGDYFALFSFYTGYHLTALGIFIIIAITINFILFITTMIAFTLQKRIKQNTTTSLPEVNPSLQSKAPAIMSLTDIPKPDDQSLTVRLHPNPVTPPPQSPMRVSVQRESVPSIIPIAQPKKKTNERQIKTPTKKPTFSKIVSKTTFERDGKKIQQTIKLDKNGHEIIIEKEIEKKVITRKFDAKTKKQVGTTTTKTTRKKQSRTAVVKHLPKVSAKIDDSYTTTPDMLEGEDIPFTSETDNLHILPPETKLESPHTPDKTPKDVSIPDINYEEDEE